MMTEQEALNNYDETGDAWRKASRAYDEVRSELDSRATALSLAREDFDDAHDALQAVRAALLEADRASH
jgi:predicted O-linked N-acetylglucosamine transferase (SPINDLY family)